MKAYTFFESDYTLICTYEYEPPLSADDVNPAWEGCVTITGISINGSPNDAYDLINPRIIQRMESEILESLQWNTLLN